MKKKFIDVYLNLPLYGSFTYSLPANFIGSAVGRRVVVDFRRRKLVAFVVRSYEEDEAIFDYPIKEVLKIQDDEPLFGEFQIQLAHWISQRYFCSEGEALSNMLPGGKREVNSLSLWDEVDQRESAPPSLNDEQKSAVERVLTNQSLFFYLYGVTGSGKTEVYLSLAEKIISQGKGVLYLVPEIALTHQLTALVSSRFGERVSVIHSHLTPAQKFTQWRRILRGEVDFVIGARSAIFAPLESLGLIILDEEHEGSYKSQSNPRYHARQVAMYLAQKRGAKMVMGSATPSVEAYDAMEKKAVVKLSLTQRAAGGSPPRFRVIDMRGRNQLLSTELIRAIKETVEKGRQVILFLNRRGFSYSLRCRTCGYQQQCPSCSLPMTYHKHKNHLLCHCCGRVLPYVATCPQCQSLDVGYDGIGTEKVAEEIRRIFPHYQMERVDRDTIANGKELGPILHRFRSGETKILLGTQMIAKGLNFPNLKLVGIITIDNILNLPDFRASERAFSLIMQVAGRTGRYSNDGEVYIQTQMGGHPALAHAINGTVEEFYRQELQMRQLSHFPPHQKLIHIVARSTTKEVASQGIEQFAKLLLKEGVPSSELLGPTEAPLAKLNGKYRYHCLLRGLQPLRYASIILSSLQLMEKQWRNCQFDVDCDPQSIE